MKANHKYLDDYDKTKPSRYIYYIYANALYSKAMTMMLPIGGYRWLHKLERFIVNDYYLIRNMPEDGLKTKAGRNRGFLFEIDGYYPKEVQDQLSDYIPLPENRTSEVSQYMQNIADATKSKVKPEVKLICGFNKKEKSVVHYAELKSAMKH